ncbi:lipopolysaccharide biosynthesis protein [Priestia megaterium]|uniref:lipopolysaccharide biosynthesis protein n=1 Tax=Priestia megaterium TaxID=1404 RepID=UPI00398F97BC
MKRIISQLIGKKFVRNVIVVATGTAAAQAVILASSPFITRLYGPETFGILGIFTAIIGIVIPIASFTYPTAIVLPTDEKDAKGIAHLSLIISFIVSILGLIILLIFNNQIIELFKLQSIEGFLYYIPLLILFSGFQQVLEQWLIRTNQFKITARVTFTHSLIVYGGIVFIGFFYPSANILVVLTVIGQALKGIMMLRWAEGFNLKPNTQNHWFIHIKQLARKYIDFPLYRASQSFIDVVTQNLPILFLTSFFGTAAVGYYSIGRTVLNIPSKFIGKSVGDVFYPRIIKAANRDEDLVKLLKKATFYLLLIGLIPYGIVIVAGPFLFSIVFGDGWNQAGEYARWISIWSLSSFILQPSIRALPVLSAQSLHLKITIISLLIRIIALAIGKFVFSSDTDAIALFAISSAILNVILIYQTFYISKKFSKGDKEIF